MSLISRVSNIVLHPNTEWPVVAAEPANPAAILAGYVAPLAAIAPIAAFIGQTVIGVSIPFVVTYRTPFIAAVTTGILSYLFAFVGVLLVAVIVDLLAPSFGAAKSWPAALKVAAYSLTPSFLAGIFGIIPFLGVLALFAGLYGIFLLFTGLPVVMGNSKEKAPLYTVTVVGCTIVLGIILAVATTATSAVTMAMTGGFSRMAGGTSPDKSTAENAAAAIVANAVGGNAANQQAAKDTVSAVESAAAQAETAGKSGDQNAQAAAGLGMLKALVTGNKHVAIIPRDQMKTVLPASVGDMASNGEPTSESGAIAGIKGSKAGASYKNAAGTLSLEVSDLGNAGGLALLAGTAANFVESETDAGYEKNVDVGGGQKVHESWTNATKHAELFEVVDSRFAIGVTSDGIDMDTALKALQSVDVQKMKDLAAAQPAPAATQ
jgi:hypothetical protein